MDRLEAMRIFATVVEKGSFTAAAKELRTPLPTVSRKVAELETHLKTQLLRRSTRKLALTDAGSAYLAAAHTILENVDAAERAAAGEFAAPRGELTITAPVLFGQLHIVPIIAEFLAKYPQINVRLMLSDRNLHLIEDHVDIAVRIGELSDSGLRATRVGSMRIICCAAPSLLAAHGVPATPNDLHRLPTVNFDQLSSDSWLFRDHDNGAPIVLERRHLFSAGCAAAAADAAVLGVGVARLLHYQAAHHLADGRLTPLLCDFEPNPLPIQLLYGAGAQPAKTRAFLDFAASRLRTQFG